MEFEAKCDVIGFEERDYVNKAGKPKRFRRATVVGDNGILEFGVAENITQLPKGKYQLKFKFVRFGQYQWCEVVQAKAL